MIFFLNYSKLFENEVEDNSLVRTQEKDDIKNDINNSKEIRINN